MKFFLAAVFVALVSSSSFAAEEEVVPSCEYIEFRVQPELGQILISSNWMKGTVGVNRLANHADELESHGIIPCTGDHLRAIYRKTKLGGKTLETLILSEPPANAADDPDATWTTRVIIVIDGVRKIDMGLGAVISDEINVYDIQLFPEDDTLMVTATDAEGHDLALPDGVDQLDEETVITNGTLISPEDEEGQADEGAATPVRI